MNKSIAVSATAWLMVLAGTPSLAVSELPRTTGSESLGDQLLDDLPRAVPQTSTVTTDKRSVASRLTYQPQLPMPIYGDIGEGIGARSGPQLLGRVRNLMQQAETLMKPVGADAESNTLQQAGTVQQQVVNLLDELIAELSKQCQGGQSQQNGEPPPHVSQRSGSMPSKPNNSTSNANTPGSESSDQLNQAIAKPVDKDEINKRVVHLWGHLPRRDREQALQLFSEEFLPKYELEIEQYYRRLSDENRTNGETQ